MEFWVKVMPNSNKDWINIKDNNITVHVREPARNNKANISVERLFSKITHKSTRIVSGFKQRRKKIHIDMEEQELYNIINKANM